MILLALSSVKGNNLGNCVTGHAHGELGGVEDVHELITLHVFLFCYK